MCVCVCTCVKVSVQPLIIIERSEAFKQIFYYQFIVSYANHVLFQTDARVRMFQRCCHVTHRFTNALVRRSVLEVDERVLEKIIEGNSNVRISLEQPGE